MYLTSMGLPTPDTNTHLYSDDPLSERFKEFLHIILLRLIVLSSDFKDIVVSFESCFDQFTHLHELACKEREEFKQKGRKF